MRTRLGELLTRLAVFSHQTSADLRQGQPRLVVRAKYALIAAFAGATVVLCVPVFHEMDRDPSSAAPNVLIPKAAWHVFYGEAAAPCPYDATKSAGCPANSANKALWASPFLRTDKDHRERMKARVGNEFWIGAEISPETLREARKNRANHIMLGWVLATYHVWIDGRMVLQGSAFEPEPVRLSVPMDRLAGSAPLRIAIQFSHVSMHPFPDFFNSGLGEEGFMTSARVNSYGSSRSFAYRVRPFSIFVANAMIAGIFFLFWSAAPSKQEYFYMACFALANALVQYSYVDILAAHLGLESLRVLGIVSRMYEAGFAMLLGLSFARNRRAVLRWGLPACLLVPFLAAAFLPADGFARLQFREFLMARVMPVSYAIGSLSCLLQGYYLFTQKRRGTYLPARIRKLALLGLGLALIGLVDLGISSSVVSQVFHASWYRFVHLGLVGFLGAIVFSEYRERELLIEKTPVSEYHRRTELPSKVVGTLLVADLKASETFYRHRASHETEENIVALWRSHFYTSIMKHGGTVISKKGDEIIGFFDKDRCASHACSALKAVDEMEQLSGLLEEQLKSRGAYPRGAKGFHFRAAITQGAIRPVWEKMGKSREAYWEEAGQTTPFVEASRLLEFERKFADGKDGSLLVMPARLAEQTLREEPKLGAKFISPNNAVRDKHGNAYRVALYRPGATVKARRTRDAA